MTQMEADPILSLLAEHPKSSFQLCEELWQKHNIGRSATSKRLERLYKSGKVDRYLRIERGAWIYCIPSLHSTESIQETARDIVRKSGGTLARVFNTGEIGRILSIFELGRISNIRFFTKENQTNPKMTALISKLERLGFRRVEQYLIHPSVPRSETNNLIDKYNTSIVQEADLLVYARRLFIAAKLSERMTLYRQPSAQSLAQHKFDLFGHGGRRNRIRVIVECNIRREITSADLEGFSQRIGGTIARSLNAYQTD